jgi:transposase
MIHQTKHYNKKTGVTYVYSVESYWDKEKKAPRNRQICLGKLDEVTGELIPAKRKKPITEQTPDESNMTVSVKVCGPYLLLSKIDTDLGIGHLMERCFPDVYREIMSLVYFIVQKGLPLSRCEFWSRNHLHPYQEGISSQRVSELLLMMTEDNRQRFLSLWAAKMLENDYLCYDITSISSYSKNEYIKYGYNRDGEALPQINLAMLFGQKCKLPAYYRRLPGNLPDISTLKTTVETLDLLQIGLNKVQFSMDRGFYSQKNVDELFSRHYHFILAVPTGRTWVENIIDKYYEGVSSPQNYYLTEDNEVLYAVSHLHKWGESKKRCYLHLYYNAQKAADDFDTLSHTLVECKAELENNKKVEKHRELYQRFFLIKETPKRGRKITYNETEIQRYRKRYAGFFCILSTNMKDSHEVLKIYRAKEAVENSFDDLKNQLDMKRLRVHTSPAMDARLFLQFVALIFICKIRMSLQQQTDSDLKYLTVRETMEALESLVKLKCSGRRNPVYSEITELQKKIISAFAFAPPTT